MEKTRLKALIDVAAGRAPADLVIKNCKVVDVLNGDIIDGGIAVCGGLIAGVGPYSGLREIDAGGAYAAPGFIDGHIHVESSYLSPEELGRLIVPRGTTTVISDAHEMANVLGTEGLYYMIEAGCGTALDIRWMLPSCVPATPYEHTGAALDAAAMEKPLGSGNFLGLGEFMDFTGVIAGNDGALDKILAAKRRGVLIDGHCPGVSGKDLNAYAAAGVSTEHECSTVGEMRDRIARGLYVLMRQGSACHDLRALLKGVTPSNSRRCLLCTDDCQPRTLIRQGHLDHHLRICVQEGIDPVAALQMASLNAAECYGLHDRGAIAPGRRADIVLFDNLRDFNVSRVFIQGREAAENGRYLPPVVRRDFSAVRGSFHIRDFSADKLRLPIRSDRAKVIRVLPGGVLTRLETAAIKRDKNGDYVFDPNSGLAKIAVIERHRGTGNVAVGLIGGYGIRAGAVAVSIAHDSHNVIAVGMSDADMAFAVEELVRQDGGIVLVKDRKVLERMPMPIAGLMSDQSGEWVDGRLTRIHEIAHEVLGVARDVEPVMTLSFMALPVIPELKLTDMGLFDVTKFEFTPIEA